MTTFTLQDLTPEQQVAVNNHEEMHKMFNEIGTVFTGEGKSNTFDAPNPDAIQYTHGGTLGAPEPQPSGEIPHNLGDIINNICTQLQLLATVISTVEEKSSSNESLQDCVALTLQQADWFKDLIRHELIAAGIEDIAKEAVESVVEDEVESYFDHRFDPEQHFDFNDAVENAVDDRLDDVVRDRVMESLEEVVAEKLSEASISISF